MQLTLPHTVDQNKAGMYLGSHRSTHGFRCDDRLTLSFFHRREYVAIIVFTLKRN
jgi:hypothetical protein